jgi:hypothetical protein
MSQDVAAPGPRAVIGVGIATTALSDSVADPALRRAVHEELIEDLHLHGTLVFTSTAHLEMFVAAVAQLPTSLAKAWESVLSSKRVVVQVRDPQLPHALSDLLDPAQLDTTLAPDVALVLLEADQAELLGVPDDEFSARSPGGLVEIGRITTAGRTTALLAARQILDAPLRQGVNRETEWNERFGPLCAAGSPVVVYDKFAGQQVVRRYVYDLPGSDGLTWFLTRLSMTPGRRARIITAITDDTDRGRRFDEGTTALAFRRLMEPFAHRRLRLDLVLVPDRVRGPRATPPVRFGHDRHIRFGMRTALALGTGMQAFSSGTFPETITVARLPLADAKAREEQAERAALRPPQGGWLAE